MPTEDEQLMSFSSLQEYTTKLQKMFQDITLSKELNESFKEHTAHVAADNGRPVKSESTCSCTACLGYCTELS